MQETCEKPLIFFALSAAKSEDGNGGGVLAAKNAKVAKIGGRGLSAFALSAFFAAKDGDGHGEMIFAAKNAKTAKTWGRGWSAFALSAFSVAKNRDENAEMAEKMELGEEK